MEDVFYGLTVTEMVDKVIEELLHTGITKREKLEENLADYIRDQGREDVTFKELVSVAAVQIHEDWEPALRALAKEYAEDRDECEELIMEALHDQIHKPLTPNYRDDLRGRASEVAEKFFLR